MCLNKVVLKCLNFTVEHIAPVLIVSHAPCVTIRRTAQPGGRPPDVSEAKISIGSGKVRDS